MSSHEINLLIGRVVVSFAILAVVGLFFRRTRKWALFVLAGVVAVFAVAVLVSGVLWQDGSAHVKRCHFAGTHSVCTTIK